MNRFLTLALIVVTLIACNDTKKEIEWTDSKCEINSHTSCDCKQWTLLGDKDIYMLETSARLGIRDDSLDYCFGLKLVVDGQKLSLDSVYHSSIPNKTIPYMPGFLDGSYSKDDQSISLRLKFINGGINTSGSTTHQFQISYSKPDRKFKDVSVIFLRDSTTVHD